MFSRTYALANSGLQGFPEISSYTIALLSHFAENPLIMVCRVLPHYWTGYRQSGLPGSHTPSRAYTYYLTYIYYLGYEFKLILLVIKNINQIVSH